ncbi:hypothetical protein, partial [Acinetobacter baumannii]|uniref:hypothetical protein n=1 Tax=Acinetobacter baumannii TaxID=470 RepID=UPI00300C04F9
ALHKSLIRQGLHDSLVQVFGNPNDALLKFSPEGTGDAGAQVQAIKTELAKEFPGISFKSTDVVGPKVSGELFQSGFMALGIAIVLMLGYIWFR